MKKIVLLAFVLLSLCVASLPELQMAYASPYTSIDVDTAYNMITNGSYPDLVVLDVRTQSEYDSGHIYCAVWIPHTDLEARIGELANHKDHEIIVNCLSGGRSATASGILDSHSFTKVYNMVGGISSWQSAGYPVWIATVHNVNTTFNYDTIQAAIDAPQTLDGHTILVDAGTYYEHVTINKSISLIGENRGTTIIDGSGTGTVVTITADNVKISGFTIQNSGPYPGARGGIYADHSSGNNISDNIITNNYNGIDIWYSSNNILSRNDVSNNDEGGIQLYYSDNNILTGNIASNNDYGIMLKWRSRNNNLTSNNVANNSVGIWLDTETENNVIFHNNFIDNTEQAYIKTVGYANTWDDGYPSGGNYWSDYADVDLYSGSGQNVIGSDGIGDAVHFIDNYNQDNYPLMGPISFFDARTWNEITYYVHTVSNSTISDFYFSEDDKLVSFNVTGPDGTVGFCRVTIPNELLWCDTPEQWAVLVNNTAVPYRVIENGDYTHLYFTYSHSVQNVQIEGIHVISEFPAWTSMLLILIVLTVAIAIYKRRLLKTPIH